MFDTKMTVIIFKMEQAKEMLKLLHIDKIILLIKSHRL